MFNITIAGIWKFNGSEIHNLSINVFWNQGNRNIYSENFSIKEGTVPDQGKWNFTIKVWFGIPIIEDSYEISINGTNSTNGELMFLQSGFTPVEKSIRLR